MSFDKEDMLIQHKIGICVSLLGGQSDLLSIIGSWHHSMTNEEIIKMLDVWIEEQKKETMWLFESYNI